MAVCNQPGGTLPLDFQLPPPRELNSTPRAAGTVAIATAARSAYDGIHQPHAGQLALTLVAT